MRARDQLQPVRVVELLADVRPERVPSAARRDAPALAVIRVGPQQVAHGALVWHLLQALERAHRVQRVDRRRQAAVETEDLPLDDGRHGQVVKEVREQLPHVRRACARGWRAFGAGGGDDGTGWGLTACTRGHRLQACGVRLRAPFSLRPPTAAQRQHTGRRCCRHQHNQHQQDAPYLRRHSS